MGNVINSTVMCAWLEVREEIPTLSMLQRVLVHCSIRTVKLQERQSKSRTKSALAAVRVWRCALLVLLRTLGVGRPVMQYGVNRRDHLIRVPSMS